MNLTARPAARPEWCLVVAEADRGKFSNSRGSQLRPVYFPAPGMRGEGGSAGFAVRGGTGKCPMDKAVLRLAVKSPSCIPNVW